MTALAEDKMLRKIAGDTAIDDDDIIRLDNCAARARAALGLDRVVELAEPERPTLGSLLRGER